MKRRTKIVCTLGPAVDSEEKIKGLIEAGMNVARINCSHGDWDSRRKWIQWVRKHSQEVAPVAVLVDLQGPKFRIGEVQGAEFDVQPGETLSLGQPPEGQFERVVMTANQSGAEPLEDPALRTQDFHWIPISQLEILKTLKKGARVLLGDGDVEIRITSCEGDDILGSAISGGTIKSHQGVTVIGQSFECEVITAKDLADIESGCAAGADYIALSYVHAGSDMDQLRKEVNKHSGYIRLCAKIETRAALKNIDDIIEKSDCIMVARGDMGLQMEIEEVPLAQKVIIKKCLEKGRPVITATQMLESMIHAPRPTRAEATDVANAILDGTDAVILSAETAAGQFPLEAVRYMSRIAEKAETLIQCDNFLLEFTNDPDGRADHTEAVAHGVVQLAQFLKPRAILTSTTSGRTAILVSKFRPSSPILCAAWNKKVHAQMALVWGVETVLVELPRTSDEQIANAVGAFVRQKRLKANDRVIVSAGVPPGTAGNTNMIMVVNVKP